MRAVFFILNICFLLIWGHHHAYAHTAQQVYSIQGNQMQQTKQTCHIHHDALVMKNSLLDEEEKSIFSVENEDTDFVFGRKDVQLSKQIIDLSYGLLLPFIQYRHKDRLPFYFHLCTPSYKYILQRVLRI